ncbi:MAG: PH domain-containing protein, partial [Archaeoglobaceae archaeon]
LSFPFLILFTIYLLINLGIIEDDSYALIPAILLLLFVYWLILPRKYCIRGENLEIVMGFTYKIKLSEIEDLERGDFRKTFLFKGLRFATSRNLIVIKRKKGFSITISPKNIDAFYEHLKKSIQNYEKGIAKEGF